MIFCHCQHRLTLIVKSKTLVPFVEFFIRLEHSEGLHGLLQCLGQCVILSRGESQADGGRDPGILGRRLVAATPEEIVQTDDLQTFDDIHHLLSNQFKKKKRFRTRTFGRNMDRMQVYPPLATMSPAPPSPFSFCAIKTKNVKNISNIHKNF